MNNDLISREALKKAVRQRQWYIDDIEEVMKIIDHAPTVNTCEKCDFRKFTETFIDGVVDVMNKNDITSVEQLQEILKGGT